MCREQCVGVYGGVLVAIYKECPKTKHSARYKLDRQHSTPPPYKVSSSSSSSASALSKDLSSCTHVQTDRLIS
ncbi:hypothetical protein EON64_05450 [archaeon]|nr:MAG: hypothetical protein EON64_05450 [archaeon]